MLISKKIHPLALAISLSFGINSAALGQETSSGIRGIVTTPQGTPATNTTVTITHLPSGTSRTVTTSDLGSFQANGLRVGGPYRVFIDSNQYEDQNLEDVYLELGKVERVSVQLQPDSVERIAVTASQISSDFGGTGPSSHFDLRDLETAPSVNRDIKDLVRADPRIYIDESNSDAIQCAGANPRFNSLTVDGVRMNDNFGLNSNGYPTERIPFSFDAIDQVAVELAPFDVNYGGFTSCNINAVTKSGGNYIEGGAFYDYTSDSLKGDTLEGEPVDTGDFTEKRYGVNVGGPIIEDTLFFFIAYEELEGSQIFNYQPLDNGRITQAEIDEIAQISRDLYQYEPGSLIPSLPVEDEKLLVKLDWNINDNHRANLVYNYNDGFSLAQSDSGSTRISLSNHFYERGAEFTSYVASVYSDWTDDFSTELRIGYSELDNRQISLDAASGFAEARISTDAGIDVYIGPDDSRQSNKLSYDNLSFKLAGTYYLDEHKLVFGYEFETLDVFNLFVQHSQGEYRFSSVDDFRNGVARAYYGNSPSHNPDDAAGEFKYTLNTAYFQDEFSLMDGDLTVLLGLRYDWYSSDDVPFENPLFAERYGFSNQQNLDGVDLLQPRFGFNWLVNDDLEVRGGIGLYSGGNPNVWISNSYSNDGIRNVQVNQRGTQLLGPDAVAFVNNGRPIYDVPQFLFDEVGGFALAPDPNNPDIDIADDSTNVTDPNFDIPSEWKFALGATYTTENDYVITADLLYTDKQDSAVIRDLALEQVDTAPDGRPVYNSVNHLFESDFLLTNVDGDDAESLIFSIAASKSFDNGLDLAASYAYVNAKDVNPMTSSVAFSNYHNVATADPQNLQLAHSNYEVPHRFTLNLSYTMEIFDGYETRFNLFAQANEGRPYDYNFNSRTSGLGFNDSDRQLLYVPQVDDPIVVYGPGFDQAAFNAFIEAEGLTRGAIMERNSLDSGWWFKADIRVEQQFAGFHEDHTGSVFIVMENFTNFLKDDWGVLKQGSFLQGAVNASVQDDGTYLYNSFLNPSTESRVTDPSLWELRIGVKYKF